MLELETLGWDYAWSTAFEPYAAQGLVPGRVAVQHRGEYDVSPRRASRAAASRADFGGRRIERPSSPWSATGSHSIAPGAVAAVLPRRTKFSRRAAHEPASGVAQEQVVAANVDVVFIVAALGQELDRRLLERFVTLALESGAGARHPAHEGRPRAGC